METTGKPFLPPENLFKHLARPMELDVPEGEVQIILGAPWTIIAKVASRCNMNCEYDDSTDPTNKSGKSCYMYTDDSYKQEAHFMTPAVAKELADKIAEHALKFPSWRTKLVLHGGEPLLLGEERLTELLEIFTNAVPNVVKPDGTLEKIVDIRLQTNATLLTEELMRLLVKYDVKVTASLDGTRKDNARRRLKGKGAPESYDAAVQGIKIAMRYPKNFPYILGVVNPGSRNPVETDRLLAHFNRNRDYNWPHATWDDPPPGKDSNVWDAPYGEKHIKIFDANYGKNPDDPEHTGVRIIDSIIDRLNGVKDPILVETLPGLAPVREFTVGVGGELGSLDSLVAIGENKEAFALGMALDNSTIEDVIRHPDIMSRARNDPQEILKQLAPECQACPLVTVCGGGLIHDRYSEKNGYKNPSIYCADIQALITHISRVVLLRKQEARYQLRRVGNRPPQPPLPQKHEQPQLRAALWDSGDSTLWPVYIDYAFPALTPFEELAKLLAEVNIDMYDSYYPDQNLNDYVEEEWLEVKTRNFERRAQAIEERWSYDLELPKGTVRQSGRQPMSELWMARVGQKIVGMSSVQILNDYEASLTNLQIRKEYRSEALARLLLSKAVKAAGPRDVIVYAHDASVGDFYRKYGFKETGQNAKALLFNSKELLIELKAMRLSTEARRAVLERNTPTLH